MSFAGTPLKENYHRQLPAMTACDVPADANSLYYATCFAADNNALEVRSLLRSGETKIPQVKAARDAFFNQETFKMRDLWDKNLFDDDPGTLFSIRMRHGDRRMNGQSALYLDLGGLTELDELQIDAPDEYALTPMTVEEGDYVYVSPDLVNWKTISVRMGLAPLPT